MPTTVSARALNVIVLVNCFDVHLNPVTVDNVIRHNVKKNIMKVVYMLSYKLSQASRSRRKDSFYKKLLFRHLGFCFN